MRSIRPLDAISANSKGPLMSDDLRQHIAAINYGTTYPRFPVADQTLNALRHRMEGC